MKLSRLKEIVKEELGDKGLLHFESTYAYIWNFDKTYDERLRILKINPYEIIHTIEPTKEMQLIAVESRPNLIGKINKPTIKSLTEEEAKEWAEDNLNTTEYINIFGPISE